MLLIGCLVLIITTIVFQVLKNKQENRAIDRRNKLAEKQDELIEMLQNKNETTDEN
jgi:hypothetical protein